MFRERRPSVRWVLPDGRYNPLVAEGVRWLDYERAAESGAAPANSPPDDAATLEPADPRADSPDAERPDAERPDPEPSDAELSDPEPSDSESPDLEWLDPEAAAPPDLRDEPPHRGAEPRGRQARSSGSRDSSPEQQSASLGPWTMAPGHQVEPPGMQGESPDACQGEPLGPWAGSPDRRGQSRDAWAGSFDFRGESLDAQGESPEPGGGDWFDLPQRPPRLADCRPYGVPGGLAHPDPQVERDLAEALRPGDRFPDPRGTWVRLVNGGGPADDPFRASNAADCALAVMSTWYGEPAAAAPRYPEYDRIGRPLLTGEQGSLARIERWIGHPLRHAGQGRHAYPMIARRLQEAGHGAAAVIVVRWPGGGCHAWNAVNSDGEVIWIDAQRGHMSVEPAYTTVTGVFCVILDRRGRPR
ncbi:toxin glutamine deamidase domain-containing protein [Nonomuraea phyllanthi]|uniref:toxin glutamine deamidase domain-containing protein n=1 Tax=Nonomuraea phyllanthi TaxID=2219224 RepID=UPI001D01F14C|nr:toxin glutamine deamidase domain-containing protein [Nonomuraea phyllanthi]